MKTSRVYQLKIITSRLICVYKPLCEAYIQSEIIELNQLPLIYFIYGLITLMIGNIIKEISVSHLKSIIDDFVDSRGPYNLLQIKLKQFILT